MDGNTKVIFLGVGGCALAVADFYLDKVAAGQMSLYGTTRNPDKISLLESRSIKPLLDGADSLYDTQLQELAKDAFILVSYPPQKDKPTNLPYEPVAADASDSRYALLVQEARKIVYISSTGVYGSACGVIDETTPTSGEEQFAPRLACEKFWQERGACILRAPGLYSPQTGLHKLLQAGKYKLPGDGSNFVSRIHLDDLAAIIDAAFRKALPGSLFVVGDLKPATHIEVVTWLCHKLDLPMPPTVPLDEVHVTLRGNRRIDSSLVRRQLHVSLQYPTYVEGLSQCLAAGSTS